MKNKSDNLVVHFVPLQLPTGLSTEPSFKLGMAEWKSLADPGKQDWVEVQGLGLGGVRWDTNYESL